MYEHRIENIRFPLKIVHLAKGICNSISFADNFLCLCLSEADSLDSLIVNALKVGFIYILNSYKFIKELGRLTSEKTKEKRSTSFIMQNISMEIQRGNCASVLCTIASPKLLNELFELFKANDFD